MWKEERRGKNQLFNIKNRTCKSKPCQFLVFPRWCWWCYLLFTCLENLWLRALKRMLLPSLALSLSFSISPRAGEVVYRDPLQISLPMQKGYNTHTCTYTRDRSTKKHKIDKKITISVIPGIEIHLKEKCCYLPASASSLDCSIVHSRSKKREEKKTLRRIDLKQKGHLRPTVETCSFFL